MESLNDIVAQMRGRGEDGRMDRHLWNEYADRIEAAAKRERAPVGNAAAMRAALVFLRDKELYLLEGNVRHCVGLTVFGLEQTCKIMRGIIEEALSAPARQCDVGTADEQDARFSRFCVEKSSGSCSGCPDAVGDFTVANGIRECALVWAQTPYDAEKGGKA